MEYKSEESDDIESDLMRQRDKYTQMMKINPAVEQGAHQSDELGKSCKRGRTVASSVPKGHMSEFLNSLMVTKTESLLARTTTTAMLQNFKTHIEPLLNEGLPMDGKSNIPGNSRALKRYV